ncbi:cytochrome P450, partial [Oryctes borbonicus]
NIFRKFPNVPYVGVYIVNRPGLLIRDPKLIKEIVLTNFSSFHDNDLLVDEKVDPIFGGNPFTNKGDQWKIRRANHTPQFSSGKIKNMFGLMDQGGDRMIKFIGDQISNFGSCTIEAMELAAKFTIYNVSSCALGIDPRTFDDENAEMRVMGRKIMEPNFYNGVKQILIFILPSLAHILTVRLVPTEVTERFKELIREQLQYRKENNIVRNDFFENIQEYKGQKVTLHEMLIQIGGLFLDGFATNSTALTFVLYELAVNLNVQHRLAEEIDEYLANHKGNITYEVFQEMPYLDAVVAESLRKYPPIGALTKICTKAYTLPPTNDKAEPYTVQPGTPVVLPLSALHYDEKYFDEPHRFDPTRFLGENKRNIEACTYMPFNEGPRACLGKRFGLVQSKMMLLKLISEYEFRLSPKTKTPIEYDVQSFLLAAKGGVWIDIHKRQK